MFCLEVNVIPQAVARSVLYFSKYFVESRFSHYYSDFSVLSYECWKHALSISISEDSICNSFVCIAKMFLFIINSS